MNNKTENTRDAANQRTGDSKQIKVTRKKNKLKEAPKEGRALDGRKSKGMPTALRTAVRKMPRELAAKFVQFYRLLLEGDRSLIEHHHAVGSLVRELMEQKKYGERVVEDFAKLCAFDAGTLYRWKKVARVWTATALKKIARRTNAHGRTITWSHLEKIAEHFDPPRGSAHSREELVQSVLEKDWTVAQLSSFLNGANEVPEYATATRAPPDSAQDEQRAGAQDEREPTESARAARPAAGAAPQEKFSGQGDGSKVGGEMASTQMLIHERRAMKTAAMAFALQKKRWLTNIESATRSTDVPRKELRRHLSESLAEIERFKREIDDMLKRLRAVAQTVEPVVEQGAEQAVEQAVEQVVEQVVEQAVGDGLLDDGFSGDTTFREEREEAS